MTRFWIVMAFAGLMISGADARAQSDYQWTFGSVSIFDYSLTAVSSTDVYAESLPASDPTINLEVGKRYEVTNQSPVFHPLGIIANGGSAAEDIVLLRQGNPEGTLENDAEINWTDSSGVIAFTMTQGLLAAMMEGGRVPGYRCETHEANMRGEFNVEQPQVGVPIEDPIEEVIAKGSVTIELMTVVEGTTSPLGLVEADDGRMFVHDQTGRVLVLIDGEVQAEPFLDISDRLVDLGIVLGTNIGFDERGLIGFALHPDFGTNGLVYTYSSEPTAGAADFTVTLPAETEFDHQAVIAEWQVSAGNANAIDRGTRREIMRVDEPQFNHNGGTMRFGPDGHLYIGFGDGGGADDQDGATFIGGTTIAGHGESGNGQNMENILGTIVRIAPQGSGSANGRYGVPGDNPFVGAAGVDEIWAYGLRNPYAFSFDRATGELYCGDVGQNQVEEVDLIVAGGNYGWRHKEGSFFFDPNGTDEGFVTTVAVGEIPEDVIDPIAEYDHDEGISITGGFVYRGSAIPELVGRYVFGDFSLEFGPPLGRLFYLDEGNVIRELVIGTEDRPLGLFVKGFGEDADGELYVCGSTESTPSGTGGAVMKMVAPGAAVGPAWRLYGAGE